MGVPILEPRDAGEPLLPHHGPLVEPIAAAAVQESHLGIEAAPDLDDAREVAPRTRLVTEARAVCGRPIRRRDSSRRFARSPCAARRSRRCGSGPRARAGAAPRSRTSAVAGRLAP